MCAEVTALGDDFAADQRTEHPVVRGGRAFRCVLGIRQPPDLQQGGAVIEGAELFEEGWIGHGSFLVYGRGAPPTAHRRARRVPRRERISLAVFAAFDHGLERVQVPVHARNDYREHATVARRCCRGATPAYCPLAPELPSTA